VDRGECPADRNGHEYGQAEQQVSQALVGGCRAYTEPIMIVIATKVSRPAQTLRNMPMTWACLLAGLLARMLCRFDSRGLDLGPTSNLIWINYRPVSGCRSQPAGEDRRGFTGVTLARSASCAELISNITSKLEQPAAELRGVTRPQSTSSRSGRDGRLG
jgi:hypothetical protein